jgi:hypothetical protein
MVFFFLSASTTVAAQDPPATADQLVNKAIAARGGEARIKAVQSQRVSGTISFGPGADGPFLVELKRPGKVHMEVKIQDQTIMRIYDGRDSAWLVNPFSGSKGPVAMTGSDLQNIVEESDFDGPLVDYQAKGNKIELMGKDQLSGKAVLKLKLTTRAGEVRTYSFDAATFLLARWEGTRKSEDQEVPVETFFSNYRDVNGLKFAFEVDSDSPGIDRVQKLTVEKIELDAQIDDTRFNKPSEPSGARPAAPESAKPNPER